MSITRIAVVTNDGNIITGHFGMGIFYQVFTTEDGKITSEEQREKPHHTIHPDFQEAQQHDHTDMLAPIRDCQVLVVGGMRKRAYEHAVANGLQVIMAVGKASEIVQQYLDGSLISDTKRIREW